MCDVGWLSSSSTSELLLGGNDSHDKSCKLEVQLSNGHEWERAGTTATPKLTAPGPAPAAPVMRMIGKPLDNEDDVD